jgi:ubiquinone/menaquinone biosynthesis C-methylase UbiE
MDTTRVGKYYDRSTEQGRFDSSHGRLEFLRSKIILERELPPPPARIIDIGGATGAYSFWLADRGYDVSLVDLSERHVEIASEKNREAVRKLSLVERADALGLPFPDGGFDAALIMGPLYHLLDRDARIRALREARRVIKPDGFLAAAFISRYASLIDGYRYRLFSDPAYVELVRADLASGEHLPPEDRDDYFTEAYFHDPASISGELEEAGFRRIELRAVEGFAWMLPELGTILDSDAERKLLLHWLDRTDTAPSLLGASAHFLACAR